MSAVAVWRRERFLRLVEQARVLASRPPPGARGPSRNCELARRRTARPPCATRPSRLYRLAGERAAPPSAARSSAASVPAIWTPRGSACVSLTNSARAASSRLPMMPSPTVDLGRAGSLRDVAERDDRAVRAAVGRRAGRSRCCLPCRRSFAWRAMRSITVARSSDEDRSRARPRRAPRSRACGAASRRTGARSRARRPSPAAIVGQQAHLANRRTRARAR